MPMEHILECHEMVNKELVGGQGSDLYDAGHHRYIDFEAGVWCTGLGHNHPRINNAIANQLSRLVHLNFRYANHLAEEAAAMILQTAHMPDGKCVFLSAGSEAVEFGVETARRVTGRSQFITLDDSYLAAYGSAGKKDDAHWIALDWSPCRTCLKAAACDDDCGLLRRVPYRELAGFVFEPGSASGQVRFPPRAMVGKLAAHLKQHQGLVVVDEVTTGCGRTGKWWGFQHYDLIPDIIAAGKGIGNGYPVSAVMMSRDIGYALERQNFHWVQSHQNDPLGCRVVAEVLKVMTEEDLPRQSAALGAWFVDALEQMARHIPGVKEIRGRGLMIALEMDRETAAIPIKTLYEKLLAQGFLVGYSPPGNNIRFYPALTIPEADITRLIHTLKSILEELK